MIQSTDTEALVSECLSLVLKRSIDAGTRIVRKDEDDWDSLRHVELIFMLEDRTGARFTEEEITSISDSSDLIRLVQDRHGS